MRKLPAGIFKAVMAAGRPDTALRDTIYTHSAMTETQNDLLSNIYCNIFCKTIFETRAPAFSKMGAFLFAFAKRA